MFDRSGYSDETRCVVYACADQNAPIALRDWPAFDSAAAVELDDERLRTLRDALGQPTPPCPYVEVMHKTIRPASRATLYPDSGPTVLRTMFETDALPKGWAEQVNRFDRVWVPTEFNVETFSAAGVAREKLRTFPQTVDFALLHTAARDTRPNDRLPDRSTRFLSVFEFSERKGWRLLLDAWCDAFKPDDDVALVIKCSGLVLGVTDATARITSYLSGRAPAPILVIDDPLDSYAMARLYAGCDAFVLPSRGEGWGRPFMEAMALGLPTIGPRWGGNMAFMTDQNSFLVPGEPVAVQQGPLVFERYLGQRWFEPDRAVLADLMRHVAAGGPDVARRARHGAADIAERFSHEQLVRRLLALTDEALA